MMVEHHRIPRFIEHRKGRLFSWLMPINHIPINNLQCKALNLMGSWWGVHFGKISDPVNHVPGIYPAPSPVRLSLSLSPRSSRVLKFFVFSAVPLDIHGLFVLSSIEMTNLLWEWCVAWTRQDIVSFASGEGMLFIDFAQWWYDSYIPQSTGAFFLNSKVYFQSTNAPSKE